jgi:hypothetical protein
MILTVAGAAMQALTRQAFSIVSRNKADPLAGAVSVWCEYDGRGAPAVV